MILMNISIIVSLYRYCRGRTYIILGSPVKCCLHLAFTPDMYYYANNKG